MSEDAKGEFEAAGSEADGNLLGELAAMLKENKKYWMIPIVAILLLFGALIMLGGTAAAPFIYQIF